MKSSLQLCTESYFKHAYAARRQASRDRYLVQSLAVIAHVPSRKIGRAALTVLREIRMMPKPDAGSAA